MSASEKVSVQISSFGSHRLEVPCNDNFSEIEAVFQEEPCQQRTMEKMQRVLDAPNIWETASANIVQYTP